MRAELGSSEPGARKVTVKLVLLRRHGCQRQQQAGRGYNGLEHHTLALPSLLRLGPRVIVVGSAGRCCVLAGVVACCGPRSSAEQLKRAVHGVVRRFGFLVRLVY